jgi:hypothetical protein
MRNSFFDSLTQMKLKFLFQLLFHLAPAEN